MKHTKDRVIAIDYFRGICILLVVLSHSAIFSMPFAYITGVGRLWTSAAEMFFLLSGVTFWIVRGKTIKSDFRLTLIKSWKRAGLIYALNLVMVFISLLLAYFFISSGVNSYMPGELPSASGLSLILKAATLSYAFGWATFLMFYSIFLIIAPFAMYVLRSRFWATVPLISAFIFIMNASPTIHITAYTSFAIWQFYFFIGLTLARFRVPLIHWFYSLPRAALRASSWTLLTAAGAIIFISAVLGFSNKLYSAIYGLTKEGWLPLKLKGAYSDLLHHKSSFDFWLGDNRYGVLRPIATLIVFAAAYVIYQKYKKPLLEHTGKFVNAMGRDTLWIFVAQAMAIPILAALPLPRNIFSNLLLTSALFILMWGVVQRRDLLRAGKMYLAELKAAFYEGKDNYLYQSSED